MSGAKQRKCCLGSLHGELYVDAIFHRWGEDVSKCPATQRMVSSTVGIVEIRGGNIVLAYPENILFDDGLIKH